MVKFHPAFWIYFNQDIFSFLQESKTLKLPLIKRHSVPLVSAV